MWAQSRKMRHLKSWRVTYCSGSSESELGASAAASTGFRTEFRLFIRLGEPHPSIRCAVSILVPYHKTHFLKRRCIAVKQRSSIMVRGPNSVGHMMSQPWLPVAFVCDPDGRNAFFPREGGAIQVEDGQKTATLARSKVDEQGKSCVACGHACMLLGHRLPVPSNTTFSGSISLLSRAALPFWLIPRPSWNVTAARVAWPTSLFRCTLNQRPYDTSCSFMLAGVLRLHTACGRSIQLVLVH